MKYKNFAFHKISIFAEKLTSQFNVCFPLKFINAIESKLAMIYGQNELRTKMKKLARRVAFNKKRGEPTIDRLHKVFSGNLGTGKTMAARCVRGTPKIAL